jgi:hypothetical protein
LLSEPVSREMEMSKLSRPFCSDVSHNLFTNQTVIKPRSAPI